ncbi:DUF4349 domain-containing protein [Salinibacterium sp. UTAS2018]|uniref:DUF4349 domain-containing protein n=1 Tax=Salinibacterium sp. UTAS2018 TaxID=2508880 RepID=UPI0010097A88|nr:DUF4349 domain-containing protein [Salinibacterium sp. UTAS2018]QAV71223.1 DUF4349 domain-containing protein [Salinibacterium sp. UTAS2018]
MRRTLKITTALALSLLVLSGCSAGMSDMSSSESGDYLVEETGEGLSGTTGNDQGIDAPAADGALAPEADISREVITTGYMAVTVTSPDEASAEAIRITESVGGRVDGRNEYAPSEGNRGSSMLTLRIPASDLTATLDKFKELGELQEVSINAQDVTMQSRDLEARITALDASVDRLLALLTKAEDTDTLIKLETAISDRQGELESLKSQKRYFDDQVAMSTLTLSLVSEADAPSTEPNTFLDGLDAGWAALVAFFSGLLVLLGVLLPWIVFLAIIAGIIVVIVRASIRSHRRSTTATAPAAAPAATETVNADAPAATPEEPKAD